MGILRTNEISGLETPTAVTGSVVFDGTGDYLSLAASGDFSYETGDFTIETWIYPTSLNSVNTIVANWDLTYTDNEWGLILDSSNQIKFQTALTNIITASINVSLNRWFHIAVSRSSGTIRVFVNGILGGSSSTSYNFSEINSLGVGGYSTGASPFTGYISNLRILKGTALYTENFTPPVHELQPIGDTVLLCCNNPDSAGAEATGKEITVNGDAAASTVSPGLTRDFTFGTQFQGVAKFDTQGYFVPPSGTTEQRGAGNAIFAGGYIGPAATNIIEYMNLNSSGSQRDFGDLKGGAYAPSVTSSSTRALIAGGYISSPAPITNIDYVTLSSSGMNALDFGDLSIARRDFSGCSNNTRSVFGGGTTTGSTNPTASMEYMTSASLGSVASFGDLLSTGRGNASCSSPTRGIFFGGYQAFATPVSTYTNAINYITIATTGSAADFGDLVIDNNGKKGGLAAFSNSTRGVVGGGAAYFSPAYTVYNTIEYITITSTGNAQDFGNLTLNNTGMGGCASRVRAINAGGQAPAANSSQMGTMIFASTGSAVDFGGDLDQGRDFLSGCSNETRGLFIGGRSSNPAGGTARIDYMTIASTGVNAQSFGTIRSSQLYYCMSLASSTRGISGASSPSSPSTTELDLINIATLGSVSDFGTAGLNRGGVGFNNPTRGVFAGGYNPGICNVVSYITIATTGNTADFGDLTRTVRSAAAAASPTRGVVMGGKEPGNSATIDYLQIMTQGNAVDFGDLVNNARGNIAGASNAHGGL